MKGRKPELRVEAKGVHTVHPPVWLSEAAQAEWRRVMPILTERRILTDADLGSLENYCIAIGRVRETEAMIQAETDPEMTLKLYRAQDKAMATARQIGGELGVTPTSRSRPTIRDDGEDGDDEPNPLDM